VSGIVVIKAAGGKPFYLETQRHETDVEFVTRVMRQMADESESKDCTKMASFAMEFVFDD
jgi:hypothetical protein